MKYKDFPVSVEGTWNLPASYPFSASFRVMFEKACVENSGAGFILYTDEGKENIVIEKQDIGATEAGGNISDLGGYYKELLYFTDCAKKSAPVERATLADATASLRFLLNKELPAAL